MKIPKILIVIMLLINIVACKREVDFNQLYFSKKGVFYKNEDKPFIGTAINYYSNSNIKNKLITMDEYGNGNWTTFYENGDIQEQRISNSGYFESTSFDNKGRITKEVKIINNQISEVTTSFYPNGQIYYIIKKKNGKEDGEQISYTENGTMLKKHNYKDGKHHGDVIDYYDNGRIYRQHYFVDGILNGEAIWFKENGTIDSKAYYINGVRQ